MGFFKSRTTLIGLSLLSYVVFLYPLTAEELDDTEILILKTVDESQAKALDLLKRSVDINSGSLNVKGVRQVGTVFQKALEELCLETEWVDGSSWQRGGHLIARSGNRGKHFLLIGHLDTVFEPFSPFQQWQQEPESNIVKGPGITDMKGGNVVIVEVIRALKQAQVLDQLTLTVVLIGDEESSGRPFSLSRKHLTDAAKEADIALAFENGDDNPATGVVARRGFTGWKLTVTGTPAHSSQIFTEEVGYGAIYEMARILNEFREQLSDEQYLTFNPGVVLGGTTTSFEEASSRGSAFGKSNVIAEKTTVSGDLRTLSIQQLKNTKSLMREIVSQNLDGTSASIEFTDGYPPFAPAPGNLRLLAEYDQVSRDLGFGVVTAVDPADAGAADISFTAGLVDMAMDGLGLLGGKGHTVDEYADISLLPIQTKRAAVLIYRLARAN